MSIELVIVVMFGALVLLLILGLPLVFCLTGISVVVIYMAQGWDALLIVVLNTFGLAQMLVFIACPFFIFMGAVLERAGLAEALFECIYRWSGKMRGGLAVGTVIICAIFAAMTGVTGAATVTMGLIAIPAMLDRKYKKSLALGTVAGAGTLGILIPPSIPMILLAVIGQISVGKLFMAGVFTGLVLVALYILYIVMKGLIDPQSCPAHGEKFTLKEKIVYTKALILPGFIILAVLGSIMFGIATPTEASAVGAFGCLIAAAVHRRLNWKLLKEASITTFRITGMVIWIAFGAIIYSCVLTGFGSGLYLTSLMEGLEVSRWVILIGMMGIIFFLGMFLDPTAIIFIAAPVGFTLTRALGFDSVWFGILFIIGLQMGYITPPFGFNLFYLKATVPPGVTMADIYRSIWPFLIIMFVGLALIMIFPQIALWLPKLMLELQR